ncbi:zinc finger TRAF-type-containing protein 1-A [Parasteatoda tepidariorum]|uniref:zinc finger TRAF-type-containing protein 1-A n=1 Tax=Parasteatoda tepidariorum TaxID=114398 RepID=UPI00077FB3C5|nr:cysteine and histidine-rich protein 1-A [Parasteatoda tepidariorum]
MTEGGTSPSDSQFQANITFENPVSVASIEISSIFKNEDKSTLKFKLKEILRCAVCLELRRSAIFQCKYGHLICAGCFGEILNESRLQNEIASCPTCQTTISKDLCSRNIAVERTISELPMTCPHCSLEIVPEIYKVHKKSLCDKRPAICCNHLIGCPWEGPYLEKYKHQEQCKQLYANGYEILKALTAMDQENKEEVHLYERIFELLSVEKFSYFDLQFKASTCTCENKAVTYETSKFSAFDNLWLVSGNIKEEPFEFQYKLILKTKLSGPLSLHYLLVKGPYSDMEIKPQLRHFTFTDKASESPSNNLVLWYNTDSLETFFLAKRINFRIFLFINK